MLACFENAKLFVGPNDNTEQHIGNLAWLAPRVMSWLDSTHVSDSAEAKGTLEYLHGVFYSFADWTQLNPKQGAIEDIRVAAVRMAKLKESLV